MLLEYIVTAQICSCKWKPQYSQTTTRVSKHLYEWRHPAINITIRVGARYPLESISKPRLSTGSEFFIFNRFPRGHYLVWWVRVRVRVSLGVKVRVSVEVRVRVSNLLGS